MKIPRARNVGQSWITTPFSTLHAVFVSAYVLYMNSPDLIIANGPGTCVPVGLLGFLFRVHSYIINLDSGGKVYNTGVCGICG